ncbi:unnamed protein product [marine sediment metagenome]|uniref:Uncharacterized protein n=1 Tax=marine sediment metagenome TaxID=412755 RepID=X0ZAV4_9ZZZZ
MVDTTYHEFLLGHLAKAEERVALARELVEEQLRVVDDLKEKGQGHAKEDDLLETMRSTLSVQAEELTVILAQLGTDNEP